jgi:Cu-Zn family superoxide dismutase
MTLQTIVRNTAATVALLGVLGSAVAPLGAFAEDVSTALKDPAGALVGTVKVTDAPTGVIVDVDITKMKPGWHAMHFHDMGDCSDPKFAKAGAHMNHPEPGKRAHGFMTPAGGDFGDLPNIYVAADGTGKAEAFTNRVSVKGEGGRPALLDADGSALIIHENPDDFITQPIGNAGARVACAAIHN